jgi:uncharacterized damage-inducible protein DinB
MDAIARMKTKSNLLMDLWIEARTRFSNQLLSLTEADLKKRLLPAQNSVGFLIRHIGDVELLFAKNVFGATEVKVSAKTVIEQKDTGDWIHLQELTDYVQHSFDTLKAIIAQQTDEDWETTITTKEFGAKTKAEALGRIVSHTAYHAGQLAIIRKYGTA